MAEYDSVIPAGGSGKLIAEIRTTPFRARRLSKSIVAQTDAADASSLTLRFTVDARAPILVIPNHRLMMSSLEGEEARQRVLLRHGDGEKLEVSNPETGSEFLDAIFEPVEAREVRDGIDAEPGDVWIELILSPEAPIGIEQGGLQFGTNHPMAQTFEIRYMTRVLPLISPSTDGVRLWVVGHRDGRGPSSYLNLILNKNGSFKITDIEVTHPEIFSAAAVGAKAAQRQTVRVELVEGLTLESIPETIEGWVEISTDVPEFSKIEMPVLVAPTRAGTRRPFHHR